MRGFGASTLHCRLDCAMSARIKRRWRGCRDGGRQTSPRRRSTGSGSDETGSLDEFITQVERACSFVFGKSTTFCLAPSLGRDWGAALKQACG